MWVSRPGGSQPTTVHASKGVLMLYQGISTAQRYVLILTPDREGQRASPDPTSPREHTCHETTRQSGTVYKSGSPPSSWACHAECYPSDSRRGPGTCPEEEPHHWGPEDLGQPITWPRSTADRGRLVCMAPRTWVGYERRIRSSVPGGFLRQGPGGGCAGWAWSDGQDLSPGVSLVGRQAGGRSDSWWTFFRIVRCRS